MAAGRGVFVELCARLCLSVGGRGSLCRLLSVSALFFVFGLQRGDERVVVYGGCVERRERCVSVPVVPC